MSKITQTRFKEIEKKTDEFLQKIENDFQDKKFIKMNQLVKYLVHSIFGHTIDEKSPNKCVNRQALDDVAFCIRVYLRYVKNNLDNKVAISNEQAEQELLGVIRGYKDFFGARAAEIQAYAMYQSCDIDEYDAMDLARLLTRQCSWGFSYDEGRIQCTLSDSQLAEWIIIHTAEAQ